MIEGVVHRRADGAESRADVAHRYQRGGESGGKIGAEGGYHQAGGHKAGEVKNHKAGNRVEEVFLYRRSVQTHAENAAGAHHVLHFGQGQFEQPHDADNFGAAAGGARAAADEHEQEEHAPGRHGPRIEIGGGVAGGCDNGSNLEGRITQGAAECAVGPP